MKEFMKAVPLKECVGKKLIDVLYSDEYLLLRFEYGTFSQLEAEADPDFSTEIVDNENVYPCNYEKESLIKFGVDENLIEQWYADQEGQRAQEQKESRRKLYEQLKQEFEA